MNSMKEAIRNISKRKMFYILIILQFTLAMLYFFVTSAAIQSIFYININVPKHLDVETDRLLHLEIEVMTDKNNFQQFEYELEKSLPVKVGMYNGTVINDENIGGDVEVVELNENINLIKSIELEKGKYFDSEDFTYNRMEVSEENPIAAIVGYDLAMKYKLDIGSVIKDTYDEGYYVVKGILKQNSKWFYQTISEGMILDMGYQLMVPKSVDNYLPIHYYCVELEGLDKNDVIAEIEQLALDNNISMEVKYVSEELAEEYKESMQENKYWMFFSLVILLMISISTTVLFIAQMESRKYDIGVRVSVGYSYGKITRMLISEVVLIMTIAFLSAMIFGKCLLGNSEENVVLGQGTYTSGYYVSWEIIMLGAIIMCIMCIPAIVALCVKVKRLQPRELVGGKE